MATKKAAMRGRTDVNDRTNVATSSQARDNTTEAAFWVSHRGGPFLIHHVGACEPLANDNAGYLDNYDTAIEQGFAPCPKCMKED